MQTDMPEVYAEFQRIGQQLEKHYRDVQDLEFTIERGKLYMLQTRSAKRTAAAAVKIATDMVDEGLITQGGGARPDRAGPRRPAPARPVRPGRARQGDHAIAKGLNASPGAAVGRAVFDADTAVEWVDRGEKVVLVRIETSPDDFHGMAVAAGHPDRPRRRDQPRRGRRAPDRQAVRGRLRRADHRLRAPQTATATYGVEFKEGDWISLDGSTGEVFVGALPTVSARFEDQPELQTILGWADEVRRMEVWTNADKPEEAAQARSYGAQGIGLCRTEHMFREGERLEIVRGAILVAMAATRAKAKARRRRDARAPRRPRRSTRFDAAMAKLEVLQQGDFEGIFRAMDGLPVVIRLIDPPLHEFLPNLEEQLVKVTKAGRRGAAEEDRVLLATIKCAPRAEPDARPARLPARADDPGLREGPDPGDPQRADRGQGVGRPPEGQDHDPAGRPRERAQGDQGPPRGRGEGGRGGGRRRGRVRVRHDDRGAARRPDRGRDRAARRRSSASAPTT